jgi:mRNA-degrading endonuclease RelE of RelBE toxin-antitoxin system
MKEIITIRIEPEMKAELQKMADKDKRNISDYILKPQLFIWFQVVYSYQRGGD